MKKTIDNACFFTFFTTLDLIWPKFCHKDTPIFIFFAAFHLNMSRDSINICNFNWNPVFPKKIAKTTENYQFWSNLYKNGVSMGYTRNKNQFFCRNNKTRP